MGAMTRFELKRLLRFGTVAAIGWGLDFGTFLSLHALTGSVYVANGLGGIVGVTFVFVVSTHRVFEGPRGFQLSLFLTYVGFNVASILTFSAVVTAISHLGVVPAAAKISVLPFSFLANYGMMRHLTRRPQVVSSVPGEV